MPVSPVTPDQVPDLKYKAKPDKVMRTWNYLIAINFSDGRAVVSQREAIDALTEAMGITDRDVVFANHWLDIEDVYRNAGWEVVYVRPAYNETGSSYFTFKPKG